MLRYAHFPLIFLAMASAVAADTYSWVDDKGSIVYTDNPSSLPKKRLSKVKRKPEVAVNHEPVNAALPLSAPQKAEEKPGAAEPGATYADDAALYGGRALGSWRSEFDGMRAEMKRLMAEMEKCREQIGAVAGLNRGEYIAVQKKLRLLESEALKLQDKIVSLKKEATAAGVPLYVRGE